MLDFNISSFGAFDIHRWIFGFFDNHIRIVALLHIDVGFFLLNGDFGLAGFVYVHISFSIFDGHLRLCFLDGDFGLGAYKLYDGLGLIQINNRLTGVHVDLWLRHLHGDDRFGNANGNLWLGLFDGDNRSLLLHTYVWLRYLYGHFWLTLLNSHDRRILRYIHIWLGYFNVDFRIFLLENDLAAGHVRGRSNTGF